MIGNSTHSSVDADRQRVARASSREAIDRAAVDPGAAPRRSRSALAAVALMGRRPSGSPRTSAWDHGSVRDGHDPFASARRGPYRSTLEYRSPQQTPPGPAGRARRQSTGDSRAASTGPTSPQTLCGTHRRTACVLKPNRRLMLGQDPLGAAQNEYLGALNVHLEEVNPLSAGTRSSKRRTGTSIVSYSAPSHSR